MRNKNYIFLTNEGLTYQPDSHFDEIDNLQVIGIAKGASPKSAFMNLLKENSYLTQTNFNEVFCYEMVSEESKGTFCIKDSN